jgi:2,5-furandicarboxylate decarboxylase 1
VPKSLRSFIEQIDHQHPDELAIVSRTVDPDNYDVTAVLAKLTQRQQFPMVLFESTRDLLGHDSGMRIVSNVFASRERIADALDFPREKAQMPLSLEYARLERSQIPWRGITREEAPVKEIVREGEDFDVNRLPTVRHFEMDLSSVITMGAIMKDPETELYDVSFIKGFPKGPRKLGVSIHSPHFDRILEHYESRGKPAPFVHVIGHHPAFYLGALALAPYANDDYATIGSFLGEPLRLVPSETWGDEFLVPADAEVIIEGEIPPGVREVVDPFGEVTRHYQAQCLRPVLNVTAITHRHNAIFEDVFSGHQGHWNLGGIPKEGSVYNVLQQKFGNIQAVHLPLSGCARFACYISIDKRIEGEAKRIGIGALAEYWGFNWVVLVDKEIDVFNEQDVLWAMMTNVDPKRDIDVIQNAYTLFDTAAGYTKLIIDATRPLDRPFPQMLKVPDEAVNRIDLDDWIEKRVPSQAGVR